ncbi:YkyB family protein [Bacillus sp. JJ1533]
MLFSIEQIAAAIHVINKYAKVPREFDDFHQMKDEILKKLIRKRLAKK